MTLITPGQPIEARHFGYGVLQHVVAKRMDEFTPDERNQLAKVTFDNLAACGNAPANAPEPFMIKSKVATLMAEIVRRQGASLWTSLMPDLAAGVRLLPIRPRSRGARRSLRTFPVVTLHPRFPFNV